MRDKRAEGLEPETIRKPEGGGEAESAGGLPTGFGRWGVVRELGRGGFGVVYEVDEELLTLDKITSPWQELCHYLRMRNHSDEKSPTLKVLRAARHAGFEHFTAHFTEEMRKALLKSYMELDAMRESNIRKLLDTLQRGNSKES